MVVADFQIDVALARVGPEFRADRADRAEKVGRGRVESRHVAAAVGLAEELELGL